MNARWYVAAFFAGLPLLASFGCGSESAMSIPREDAVDMPVVAAPTIELPSGGHYSTAAPAEVVATPTAYALTAPSPRVVTATPAIVETAEIPVEDLDCSVFDSAEAAQAVFLSVGGPLDDDYSLDTNRDGIACNADTDAGADGRRWSFLNSDGPGPEGTIRPTATPDAQEPTKRPEWELQRLDLWEIDWTHMQSVGVVRIVKVGERLLGSGDLPLSFPQDECGPNVGSDLTEANWTWDEEERSGWVWVDVPESEGDYCVAAYWGAETDFFPLPVYPRDSRKVRPRVPHTSEGLIFRVDHEWRNYDVPPVDPREGGAIRFRGNTPDPVPGYTFEEPYVMIEVGGQRQPLLCGPEMMPAAIWTHEEGFVPLTIEEEQAYAKLQTEWSLLASLEWNEDVAKTKKEAEMLGWYFVLGNRGTWPFFCWNLANQEELPDTTPCLDCYERK